MARDDLFRRSFEAGTAFLDMTRERAEALVKELVKTGEIQKGKAQKAIDELLERSRKGSDELRQLIRREINEQVAALGLATKEDIARLEARMGQSSAGQATGPEPAPTKAAGLKKAGSATKPTAPAKNATGPAKKATGAGAARKAPPAKAAAKAATKAGSARKKGVAGPRTTGGAGVTGSSGITASPPPDGV